MQHCSRSSGHAGSEPVKGHSHHARQDLSRPGALTMHEAASVLHRMSWEMACRSMLDLDAGPVDDLQIARSVGADAIDKHFLADAGALSAERIETLADVGVLEDAQHFLI